MSANGTARGVGNRLEDAIGEKVDQGDEKVAGAHGRVADLDLQELRGRVERGEVGDTLGLGRRSVASASAFCRKRSTRSVTSGPTARSRMNWTRTSWV